MFCVVNYIYNDQLISISLRHNFESFFFQLHVSREFKKHFSTGHDVKMVINSSPSLFPRNNSRDNDI